MILVDTPGMRRGRWTPSEAKADRCGTRQCVNDKNDGKHVENGGGMCIGGIPAG